MLLTCPHCATIFRVDGKLISMQGTKRALFDVPSYLDGDTNIDINIDTRIQTSIDININAGDRPVGGAESSQIPEETVFCDVACGSAAQQCDHSSRIDHGLCAVSDQWV
jgi:hypothetical protein